MTLWAPLLAVSLAAGHPDPRLNLVPGADRSPFSDPKAESYVVPNPWVACLAAQAANRLALAEAFLNAGAMPLTFEPSGDTLNPVACDGTQYERLTDTSAQFIIRLDSLRFRAWFGSIVLPTTPAVLVQRVSGEAEQGLTPWQCLWRPGTDLTWVALLPDGCQPPSRD